VRARLGQLLAGAVAHAYERRGSDVFLSTGQRPRMRIDGRLDPLDLSIDDGELAACVHALSGGAVGTNIDLSLELDGVRTTRSPLRLSGTPAQGLRRPPRLGEHDAELRAWLSSDGR